MLPGIAVERGGLDKTLSIGEGGRPLAGVGRPDDDETPRLGAPDGRRGVPGGKHPAQYVVGYHSTE